MDLQEINMQVPTPEFGLWKRDAKTNDRACALTVHRLLTKLRFYFCSVGCRGMSLPASFSGGVCRDGKSGMMIQIVLAVQVLAQPTGN